MSMFINTNVGALNAHRNLSSSNNALSKTMEKLSSGLRINRAADDAAGLAISEKMRFQINGMNQAMRNAQDGISLIQTAEGALTEVHSMLQRLNTLANQSANGTYDNADRTNTQLEVAALKEEIANIAATTTFNDIALLNNGNDITFQIGVDGSTTLTAKAFNLTGVDLADIKVDTQADAKASIEKIEEAINAVSGARATFGAVQNRLEHTINNLGVTAENLSASESRIRDADMAKEMTDFTRSQILVQAGTSMLAQANSAPQNVLKLLG